MSLTKYLLFSILINVSVARADSAAILIGVGNYKNPTNNLPGVDIDIQLMSEITQWLSITEENRYIVRDSDATLDVINGLVENKIKPNSSKDDLVLIYFSGHGTRVWDENGDELTDHADEALLLYDAKVVSLNNKQAIEGLLLDDELGEMLASVSSDNILVIIDACHSGSVTKSFGSLDNNPPVLTKFFSYPGMPSGKGDMLNSNPTVNYVAISAANDDEQALPSEHGSYFTLGLYEALSNARLQGKTITPRDLSLAAGDYIRNNLSPSLWYSPQLSGNPILADKKLKMP